MAQMQPELIPKVVERLKASLADENRLRLILRLGQGPCRVTHLAEELDLSQASVSKHLAMLRQAGLIAVERRGTEAIHSIHDDSLLQLCDIVCGGVRQYLREQASILKPNRKTDNVNPGQEAKAMSGPTVSPQQVFEQVQQNTAMHLIDVRSPAEFEQMHAQGARLIPLDALKPNRIAQEFPDGTIRPTFLFCQTGRRAATAAARLRKAGLSEVYVVDGGAAAWEAAGLPVQRGRKTISLERQVRIGAGTLVLLGVLLGWQLDPRFYLLSGFVGCGLIFAGVTGFCGMAMILARMPWNRRGGATCSA